MEHGRAIFLSSPSSGLTSCRCLKKKIKVASSAPPAMEKYSRNMPWYHSRNKLARPSTNRPSKRAHGSLADHPPRGKKRERLGPHANATAIKKCELKIFFLRFLIATDFGSCLIRRRIFLRDRAPQVAERARTRIRRASGGCWRKISSAVAASVRVEEE